MGSTTTKIPRDFVALAPALSSGKDVQGLRDGVEGNISQVRIELTQLVNTMMAIMQAEVERRAEVMLQKLTQILIIARKTTLTGQRPS
jgi:hypothetical protein